MVFPFYWLDILDILEVLDVLGLVFALSFKLLALSS
jgi:hypothetical protein